MARSMRSRRVFYLGSSTLLALTLATLASAAGPGAESADPLRAEIARWSKFVQENKSTDELWGEVKGSAQPALASAQEALRDGRRLLALQRLASARAYLAAAVYLNARSATQRKEAARFEAEWTRMGGVLRNSLGKISPAALEKVRPAVPRALGEAALPQVRVYYEASLEYGRNTMPLYGLLYLGVAQAQRDFVALSERLSADSSLRPPPVRALPGELDALEREMLAAYRPPASIDKHGDFIAASSMLKEARELEAAGLRYGALLRYLQAAQRLASLLPTPPPLQGDALARRLDELEGRLSAGDLDQSIGRLFLEAARADVAAAAPGTSPAVAEVIAGDVLPRYFAALEPARPETVQPAPEVTVTLVRWPYT